MSLIAQAGEDMEKYITFSVPFKKKCDDGKTITRKLRFFDKYAKNTRKEKKLMQKNCDGLEDDTLSYKCR